jgi:hypothetical protein
MATATLIAGLKAMAIRENERPKVTAQDYGDTVQCHVLCPVHVLTEVWTARTHNS